MRTFIMLMLLAITVLLMRVKINTLEYKNAELQLMVEDVVNYSDSTADIGEFDEFIASPQGERFFDNYRKLYDK